jgi:hypothetical protein
VAETDDLRFLDDQTVKNMPNIKWQLEPRCETFPEIWSLGRSCKWKISYLFHSSNQISSDSFPLNGHGLMAR